MALVAAHLNAGVILVVTITSLTPHLHTPYTSVFISLRSLPVSVDVKHHVDFIPQAKIIRYSQSFEKFQLLGRKDSEDE